MYTESTAANNALIDYIKKSPSPFHAVKALTDRLNQEGYTALYESQSWELVPGGKYYVTRNGTTVAMFRIPQTDAPLGFMISASHSDAPTFKLKENSELASANYVRLATEGYGGLICSSWLDRPLSIAGRVIVAAEQGVQSRLIHLDQDLLMIPNVAIHMNRNINSGYHYNLAVDMLPLFGTGAAKGKLRQMIAAAAEVEEDKILSYDLFLCNRAEPTVWGAEKEFVSAPRLDDLQCAFATTEGFLASSDGQSIPVCAVFDNEEVGSSTKQGAASTFLADTLIRICEGLGMNGGHYRRMLANTMMVSADNAHAIHPNHPEYADENHRPKMNSGIVIKHNAAQKYTTDAVSSAIFNSICQKAEVPTQHFANRSDLAGGSTLGNISNTRVSVCTVDIGLPQLAMHSSYETAGSKDTAYLVKAMAAFFSSSLRQSGETGFEIIF